MSLYFLNSSGKVLKNDVVRVCKEEGLIKDEDIFNMTIIYFISTFILSSPPNLSSFTKDDFYLVESGHYSSNPWGNLSFYDLLNSISHQLDDNPEPPHVKCFGFPLALRVEFYEIANKVDQSIATCTSHIIPHIFK